MSATIQQEIDIAQDLGGRAYLDGEPMDSNPHNKETSPDLHNAWNYGWR
jgi:hypothetical protein